MAIPKGYKKAWVKVGKKIRDKDDRKEIWEIVDIKTTGNGLQMVTIRCVEGPAKGGADRSLWRNRLEQEAVEYRAPRPKKPKPAPAEPKTRFDRDDVL